MTNHNHGAVAQWAAIRGFSKDTLRRAEVLPDGDRLRFPMLDEVGNVTGYELRRADNKPFQSDNGTGQKSLTNQGGHKGLFYSAPLPETDPVIVVEGLPDYLSILEAKHNAVVATGGAGPGRNVKDSLAELMRNRSIVLIPDVDESGQQWTRVVGRLLAGVGCDIRIVELPNGDKDIDDFLRGKDDKPGALAELLAVALPWHDATLDAVVDGVVERTDIGRARLFISQHGPELRYCKPWQTWLHYDGARWNRDDVLAVRALAEKTVQGIAVDAANISDSKARAGALDYARRCCSQRTLDAMLKLAEHQAAVKPDIFDTDPWLLNVRNGTINLRAGELRPHNPDDLITQLAPVDYDPGAECPLWLNFLGDIMDNNAGLIDYLQRIAGYALTGDVREHKLFVLYGTGSNGKSTFVNTLLHVVGDYSVQTEPELLLLARSEKHPTGLTDLRGARLAVSAEIESGRKLAEVLVKQLTGGDRITARRMWENFSEFDPTHKLLVSTNHKPVITGTDHAIWRRIALIPFTVTIPDEAQDKTLPEKLLAEAPGILNWCLQGCVGWQLHGLVEPNEVKVATDAYKSEQDILGDFLDECCETGSRKTVTSRELRRVYELWCERNGETPLKTTGFGRRLTERGLKKQRSGQARSWVGIGLRNDTL